MRRTLDRCGCGSPLRFDLAWHLNACCIGQCTGLFLRFFCALLPRSPALSEQPAGGIACRTRRANSNTY
jgi:hypothetical protein